MPKFAQYTAFPRPFGLYFLPFSLYTHTTPLSEALNCRHAPFSSYMPAQAQEIIGEHGKEEMDFVSHKPHIPCPCPIKMKTEDSENFFYLASYRPELTIPFLLGGA